MKKLLVAISAIIIAFGGVLASCSADDVLETEQAENEAKAAEMNRQILAMAEEYGLSVKLNEPISATDVDSIDIADIEKLFKAIASARGRYELKPVVNKNGKVTVEQSRVNKKHARKLSARHEGGSYIGDNCNFEDEVHNREQIVGVGFYDFDVICTCSASWSVDENGKAVSATINPDVRVKSYGTAHYDNSMSNVNYDWHPIGGGGIDFNGSVTLRVKISKFKTAEIEIVFTGNCDPNSGIVFWYPQP